VLILPLQARGQLVGQVRVRGDDLLLRRGQLVRDIATRAAIALDNALLYEGEREASHRLQLGLLDFSTPDVDDCRIDVAYRPGTANLEVGGDWHDAFRLPNGSLGLVVGDVVGHGLDAAAAMAQLRGAVRALAAFSSPGELLSRLDGFVDSLPAAFMTTLVYVELDSRTGSMRYAVAGHPPPLIVSATEASRLLWGARSAPLGSDFHADRLESVDRLEDGERLVLYTDGLIERRHEEIDLGLARLVNRSQHDVASLDFVDRLCNDMGVDGTGDDICVLSVALVRSRSFATFCASRPEELSALRKQLRSWLGSLDCPAETSGDIVLAVSEAAANSIEHGAAPDGRGISVLGQANNGTISLVIRDHGRWKEPGASANRGRGLPIMRDLMDTVAVEPAEDGTVVRMEVAVPRH
jgi:serine/threonine-protein kinase RsbW